MPRVEPDIVIRFSKGRRGYAPGETLRAELSVLNWDLIDCNWAEVSVIWHTVGKGDEDLYVHHFRRLNSTGPNAVDLSEPYPIKVTLPQSPLSYDGLIVKVCWCVRLRIMHHGGRVSLAEAPFQLGHVRSPQVGQPERTPEGAGEQA